MISVRLRCNIRSRNVKNGHSPAHISCCHAFSPIRDFELTEQHRDLARTGPRMHCISSANSRHTPYQEKTAKIDKSEIAYSHNFSISILSLGIWSFWTINN
jgi:hypothetical protein